MLKICGVVKVGDVDAGSSGRMASLSCWKSYADADDTDRDEDTDHDDTHDGYVDHDDNHDHDDDDDCDKLLATHLSTDTYHDDNEY